MLHHMSDPCESKICGKSFICNIFLFTLPAKCYQNIYAKMPNIKNSPKILI